MRKITIEKLQIIASKVLSDMYSDYSEKSIIDYMNKALRKTANTLILDSLGLREDSWHPGEYHVVLGGVFSVVIDTLTEKRIKEIARVVLSDLFNEPIILTDTQKRQLQKAYKESYLKALAEEINEMGRKDGLIDAEKVFSMLNDEENT